MHTKSGRRQLLVPLILAFVILAPFLTRILVTLYVPASNPAREPTTIGRGTAPDDEIPNLQPPGADPGTDAVRGFLQPRLDPHNGLHLFALLPALAGLVILGGSAVIWVVLTEWRPANRTGGKVARMQYGLLGVLWWIALSLFLVLDLAGSVSLHLGFSVIYALCCILVGLLILHQRPLREKLLVVVLFAAAVLSVRAVHWNSRKPFLTDLGRVRLGTPAAQVDEVMDEYRKGIGSLTQLDAQGSVASGTITYRHTTEGWGNSDVGVLTIAGGRVADVEYLPD